MLKSIKDIGELFACLHAAYGHSWAHKEDALEIWYRALGGFNKPDIMRAAETAVHKYPKFPPSLGQFLEIVEGPKPRPTTYLPNPMRPKAIRIANFALLQVLVQCGGVDKSAMKNLVGLKNALAEDFPDMTKDNVVEVKRQLTDLVRCST